MRRVFILRVELTDMFNTAGEDPPELAVFESVTAAKAAGEALADLLVAEKLLTRSHLKVPAVADDWEFTDRRSGLGEWCLTRALWSKFFAGSPWPCCTAKVTEFLVSE